jgi:hypothetical protein
MARMDNEPLLDRIKHLRARSPRAFDLLEKIAARRDTHEWPISSELWELNDDGLLAISEASSGKVRAVCKAGVMRALQQLPVG